MDGHECAKRIKALYPEEKRPNVIALTASDSVEDTFECLQLGFGKSWCGLASCNVIATTPPVVSL